MREVEMTKRVDLLCGKLMPSVISIGFPGHFWGAMLGKTKCP